MCLLHKLAVRAMEDGVVDIIKEVECSDVRVLHWPAADGGRALAGVLFAVTSVCVVECGDVRSDRQRAVDLGVLALKLRLVEVVDIRHERSMGGYSDIVCLVIM